MFSLLLKDLISDFIFHKRPYKARFIANSSSCTTTELSKLLTFCLTAIKNHLIEYCETIYEREALKSFGQ